MCREQFMDRLMKFSAGRVGHVTFPSIDWNFRPLLKSHIKASPLDVSGRQALYEEQCKFDKLLILLLSLSRLRSMW